MRGLVRGGSAGAKGARQMMDAAARYAFPHDGADERRRLDLFAERLDPLTKRRIGRLGLAADSRCLEVGGGRGSIFPAGSFDLVHVRAVLMHIADRMTVLKKMASWLAPGGWLVAE